LEENFEKKELIAGTIDEKYVKSDKRAKYSDALK